MKRIGLMIAAVLLLAAPAFAQKSTAPTAIGLINFQRAIAQNDEGVAAGNRYTEEGKKLADGLLKSQGKVTELQDKLTKGGPTMSDSDKAALVREIDKAKKVYDLDQQDAQTAIDDKQDELFRPIAERVRKVVESYAKELNLAVVVNAADDIVYASDVVDITTEIIRRVNADIAKNPAKK